MPEIDPNTAKTLLSYVYRAERLEEDDRSINADKKEFFAEVKSAGFDPKIIRKIVAVCAMDANEKAKADYDQEIFETYFSAVNSAERSGMPRATQARDARVSSAPAQIGGAA